ncbi:MAG: hypothetical protein CVV64_09505 [Candidatus Wallbacteria bacterium HGW-Wallbacteria-1]|jgi:glycosyltransferase involved in cell wall biosynthesis|uniref:Glycosyltransferase family 1 protein n=1 Tax=Candidatus Wallbacteria bacterium HGW-Wallbacteria-1 TaxID=2013854 RepID=A0A2N1PQG7_9BACT|nr:MAG: hypothetical protein CVV64_09505 [Candidatus Wallbacteria bacterium HGW-Wallbacteria-1]
MKILLAANSYLPSWGGIERYLSQLGRHLHTSGHDVSVFCRKWSDDLPSTELMDNIRVIRHSAPNLPFYLFALRPFSSEMTCLASARLLRHLNPDLVICRTPGYAQGIRRVLSKAKIVYVLPTIEAIERKFDIAEGNAPILDRFIDLIMNPVNDYQERRALQSADSLVAFSENAAQLSSSQHGFDSGKYQIIPPGVDFKFFNSHCGKSPADYSPVRDDSKKLIMFAGRLCNVKGPDISLEIFHRLLKRHKTIAANCHLLFVGDGPMKNELIRRTDEMNLSGQVFFAGKRDDINRLYPWADLLLHTSRFETFGHVLLESMSCGTPCLSFRRRIPDFQVASEEIIQHGENGYLANGWDPDDVADTLAMALSDPEKLKETGLKAAEYIQKKYSWQRHIDELLKTVENI